MGIEDGGTNEVCSGRQGAMYLLLAGTIKMIRMELNLEPGATGVERKEGPELWCHDKELWE